MRWLLRRDGDDQAPRVLTLRDQDETTPVDEEPRERSGRVRFLPGGELALDVASASEARDALLELQRRQRELLAARPLVAGSGVVQAGQRVGRGVARQGRRVMRFNGRAVRSMRPRRSRGSDPFLYADLGDLLVHGGQIASGADDMLRLIGAAMHTIIEQVPDVDLSGIDLDLLDILDF